MRINIISVDKKFKKDEKIVKKILTELSRLLVLKEKYVEVYLVNDDFNVHSFTSPKNFPRPDIGNYKNLGEIYLGTKKLFNFNRHDSLKLLLIHGLLHLLGYGHKKKSDRIKMEKRERELIEALR